MKHVLVLSFSPIATDPRVMRQLQALQGRYRLTVAGFGMPPTIDAVFHDVSAAVGLAGKIMKALLLLAGMHEAYYWRIPYVERTAAALAGRRFDLIVANDVSSLPVALRLAEGAPVLLDAHEYSPREFEERWFWRVTSGRLYTHLCSRYLPAVAGMTTVCEGIAIEYGQFGVHPHVVMNCPPRQDLPVRRVDPSRIRLVHHGVSSPSRNLEALVDMMGYLDDRYTLDLMLVDPNPAYTNLLRRRAAGNARIRFRDPVPMPSIPNVLNEYDIGVYLLSPVNFNSRMALPNKFFEFVQARLAVAIGPSPEMARLAREHGFGIVADSFDARELAGRIASLDAGGIERLKQRSDVASAQLNAARAGEAFVAEVARLAPA